MGFQVRLVHVLWQKALENNQPVVSLVRSSHTELETTNTHRVYKGDVTHMKDVQTIYENHDISGTIICLGGSTQKVGTSMLTDGTRNIIHCIKKYHASKKIVIVTSIGTGNSIKEPPLFFRILMKTVLKDAFIDKNNQESLFLSPNGIGNDLDYVIVRPSGLTDGNIDDIAVIHKGSGTISRKSVANFCYNAIYDPVFPYLRTSTCITSLVRDTNGIYYDPYY